MSTDRLRLALPLSQDLEAIRDQLQACGFEIPDLAMPGLHHIGDPLQCGYDFEVFRLAPADVGTYVEHAISHMGVISTELLRETDVAVWRPYTFSFGQYPMVFAAPQGESFASLSTRPRVRIATPYPSLARGVFAHRGVPVEVVNVSDTYTACLLGLADAFVDRLVDPAPMLEHDFRVMELLGHSRLKLVVNPALGSRRRIAIQALVACLEANEPAPPKPVVIPFEDEEKFSFGPYIEFDEDSGDIAG
jgi:ATP phosphoribosyltransferase